MKIRVKFTVLASLLLFIAAATSVSAAETVAAGLHTDIEFAKVGDVSLTLDAFVPEGKGPFLTVIFVHGGGFTKGDKQSYIKPLFKPVSQAGMTWFSINYRLAPEHRWPACAEDVDTAIRWVKTHAAEYKVDPDRIALIGESAGGFLVTYAAATAKDDTRVNAIVPFYGAHDRAFQTTHFNKLGESTKALFGITELNNEAWNLLRETSSTTHLHAGMPSCLLIHGDQDPQVPLEQSVRFQKRMQELGNHCELITIPGGGHGMGGWSKLNSDYQAQMIAWLKKTLADQK